MASRMEQRVQKDKARFLKKYQDLGVISKACEALKLSRATIYRWLKSDSEFAVALEEHREAKVEHLEQTLYEQALRGNVTAAIFLLKAERPKKYCDRARLVNHAPKDDDQEIDGYVQQMRVAGKPISKVKDEYFWRLKLDLADRGWKLDGDIGEPETLVAVSIKTGERRSL